jgi:uncharacterized protein
VSEKDVTAYINAQPEPKKSTLLAVRKTILSIEPNLEQAIAWNAPVFKFNGKYVAGLCAFKNHLTFSPQSAKVMAAHEKALENYITSKSSFQFDVDKPLPKVLVAQLIKERLKEIK